MKRVRYEGTEKKSKRNSEPTGVSSEYVSMLAIHD
jgi:hypothetical protein